MRQLYNCRSIRKMLRSASKLGFAVNHIFFAVGSFAIADVER
jgi:hypothetical protein